MQFQIEIDLNKYAKKSIAMTGRAQRGWNETVKIDVHLISSW